MFYLDNTATKNDEKAGPYRLTVLVFQAKQIF